MSICLDQLYHVALQVQDIVIGIKGSAIGGIFQCKRLSRLIIDEIKDRCQGVIRFNCLSCDFAVQSQILMRDRLRSGDMSSLRGDVSSSAGASASTGSPSPPDMISPGPVGWVGMTMLLSSSREIKISGNRSFVWFKGSLSFCSLWGGPAKDETFAFSRFSTDELFKQLLLHHNETTK